MAPWTPGMAWPSGTPGGAQSPFWGGYVRFWVRAALAAGRDWHIGPHPDDRLNAGNVIGGAPTATRSTPIDRLWVDLTCDALDVRIGGGLTGDQGIFSNADAATLELTLADPDGIYDPLNPAPPWSYGSQSRLVPGTPVQAFAEVVDGTDGSWARYSLFTGTVDTWGEDWTPRPLQRTSKMVASDITKQFVRLNRPEQPAVGAGDTTAQRVARIVAFFGWPGTVDAPANPSTVTLQATTLAQSAWELLNRTLDDELGVVYFTPDGTLRWLSRNTWFGLPAPSVAFGCETVSSGAYDIIIDASPAAVDAQMRNTVYAARVGGTQQLAQSSASVARYGEYDENRTDLGVQTDLQAADWATTVMQIYAFPQRALDGVALRPAIHPTSWNSWEAVLNLELVTDIVRIVWAPPDRPEAAVDIPSRVVGYEHEITYRAWEVNWHLIASRAAASEATVFTMGPDPRDRLDAGFVLG
jgi:hypothetical protein